MTVHLGTLYHWSLKRHPESILSANSIPADRLWWVGERDGHPHGDG